MRFRAGELAFTASVTEVHEEPSPQTGAPLKWLTIQFRAQSEAAHDQALSAATERARGGLFDETDLEWRVVDSSVQFVGNPPWGVNHHTWIVQQVERVACSLLRIGTLELEPYDYVEELADGVLRLAARCTASDADLDRLRDLGRDPLDVTRVGISEQPRSMRVEDYVWGPGSHGLGVALVLAQEVEPRVRLNAVPRSEGFEEVLALLQARGMLGSDDLQELRQSRHAARRVQDVDAWEL